MTSYDENLYPSIKLFVNEVLNPLTPASMPLRVEKGDGRAYLYASHTPHPAVFDLNADRFTSLVSSEGWGALASVWTQASLTAPADSSALELVSANTKVRLTSHQVSEGRYVSTYRFQMSAWYETVVFDSAVFRIPSQTMHLSQRLKKFWLDRN